MREIAFLVGLCSGCFSCHIAVCKRLGLMATEVATTESKLKLLPFAFDPNGARSSEKAVTPNREYTNKTDREKNEK